MPHDIQAWHFFRVPKFLDSHRPFCPLSSSHTYLPEPIIFLSFYFPHLHGITLHNAESRRRSLPPYLSLPTFSSLSQLPSHEKSRINYPQKEAVRSIFTLASTCISQCILRTFSSKIGRRIEVAHVAHI